jgi:hypothetical protein
LEIPKQAKALIKREEAKSAADEQLAAALRGEGSEDALQRLGRGQARPLCSASSSPVTANMTANGTSVCNDMAGIVCLVCPALHNACIAG